MKVVKMIICVSATALIVASTGVHADPPGKEAWKAWKEQMKYEREQAKRDREWEREQRKIAREERKLLKKEEHEAGYLFEQNNVEDSSEPEYLEDKMYRVVKILRDLKDVVVQ